MKPLLRSIILPFLVVLLAGCGEKPGGSGQRTVGVAFETLQTEYWVAGSTPSKPSW